MTVPTVHATSIGTPVGPLALLARDGILVAAGFAPVGVMADRIAASDVQEVDDLDGVSSAVSAYLAGDVHAIDDLPVDQPGGRFHQSAWTVMREIPPGETISYRELAVRVGSPTAVRAAGGACARNLVAPIVPCHRVVRTGGARGGYYYGLDVKDWLLEHERRAVTRIAG